VGVPDPAPTERRVATRRDLALVLVLVVASVALVVVDVDPPVRADGDVPGAVGALLAILTCLPALVARRWSAAAACVSLVLAALGLALGYALTLPMFVALLLAGYAGVQGPRRTTALVALVSGTTVAALTVHALDSATLAPIVGAFAFGMVPVLFGDVVGSARREAADARESARRIEQLRDRDVGRAVAEERLRIARDMHDITGHHLSALALQAAGLRMTTTDPEMQEALERIHDIATAALGQTRRALGVMRADDAQHAPAPRLDGVADLLTPARVSGLTVDLTIEGEHLELPEEVEVCAYRVLQEALTNVVRHAAASRVEVVVTHGPRELELRVSDDGRGSGGASSPDGAGLEGMRERVALLDGAVDAGPAPGGGWAVTARIPATLRS
jgi:signal transduction histidine kinase